MPTVIEVKGYRIQVYIREEHPPPHVHVTKQDARVKVLLHIDGAEYLTFRVRKPKNREIRGE